MPVDGEPRYNPETDKWEQFNDPPGTWEPVRADFGQLDRPVEGILPPGADDLGVAQ